MLTTSPPLFRARIRFALFPFRSLLIRKSLSSTRESWRDRNSFRISVLFSFPAGTKMFQFPAFASLSRFQLFSDSEISGSMLACSSPELIAACHVLNHSPNQAIHLTECKIYFPFFLIIFKFSSRKFTYLIQFIVWASSTLAHNI